MKSGTAVHAEYLQFQSTFSFITYLIMDLEPITTHMNSSPVSASLCFLDGCFGLSLLSPPEEPYHAKQGAVYVASTTCM